MTRRASEFHLDDSYTGPIQEITIVADDDKSRRVCLQKFFQPFDGAHVEMIRWLVQQEHVRFRKQQTGESQTILLSAGKFLGLHLPRLAVKAQPLQDRFCLRGIFKATFAFKLVLQIAITRKNLV